MHQDSLVNGVNYNSESVVEVDPGVRSLEIRKEGEKVVALKIPQLSLEPGKVYTIIVSAGPDRKLHAIQLDKHSTGLRREQMRERRAAKLQPQSTARRYRAVNKLSGKVALITDGDSAICRAVDVDFAKAAAEPALALHACKHLFITGNVLLSNGGEIN